MIALKDAPRYFSISIDAVQYGYDTVMLVVAFDVNTTVFTIVLPCNEATCIMWLRPPCHKIPDP